MSFTPPPTRPEAPVDIGNLPAILHSALCQELNTSPPGERQAVARLRSIKTRSEAMQYLEQVRQKLRRPRPDVAPP